MKLPNSIDKRNISKEVNVDIMIKRCGTCDQSLVKVWVNSSRGTLILEELKKHGPFAKTRASAVAAYVCPNCGRVELFAKNPTVFKDE